MTDLDPTNPNAGVISCVLTIDGAPVAGGSPADSALDPAALSGLTVQWGRSTTVDQPEPATCSFSLLDLPGDQTFRDLARLGAPVKVSASATIWPDPTVSTHFDPTWSTFADGAAVPVTVTAGGTARAGTDPLAAGNRAVRVVPGPADAVAVTVPPAWPVPAGTDPAAWDSIPTLTVGQTWRAGLRVLLPAGAVGRLVPVRYAGPYAAAAQPIAWDTAPAPIVGDGAWHTVSGMVTPDESGGWLGVRLTVAPTGIRWDTAPEAWTWDTLTPAGWTWDQAGDVWLDDVALMAPAAGTSRTVDVFAGRITDSTARYETRVGGVIVDVTAQDFTADLANVYVGDDPWPAETAAQRIRRILALAAPAVTLIADPRPAALAVSRQDVDRSAAGDLIAGVAKSTDAVLRAAVHPVTGPYLRLEDPAARAPLLRLVLGAGGLIEIEPAPPTADATPIPADDVDLDPVRWQQDVSDVISRVTVDWLEQTTPDVTQRTVTQVNTAQVARVGERSLSLSGQLTSASDALVIAGQLLARLDDTSWRISGLTIDTGTLDLSPARVDHVMTLLDGTARIGRPLQVTGIPDWTPSPVPDVALYLEGGALAYIDGCWSLDLDASTPSGLGQSVKWDEPPAAWTWDQFDPSITWDDLTGVGAPA